MKYLRYVLILVLKLVGKVVGVPMFYLLLPFRAYARNRVYKDDLSLFEARNEELKSAISFYKIQNEKYNLECKKWQEDFLECFYILCQIK